MDIRKLRPLAALFVVAGLALPMTGQTGAFNSDERVLFFGETFNDTLAHASKWIDVRGANRVILKFRSGHTGAYTGADSVYTDSLLVVNVLFSDSVSFMARDSAGTIVTASSGIPTVIGTHGEPYPMCADSVLINALPAASTTDTTYKMVTVHLPPIKKQLRPAANGSGVYCIVAPALPLPGTSIYGDGSIMPRFMRIRVTPTTRMTEGGRLSTAGKRTTGIRGLSVTALIISPNK